jgi:hypothetical protein
VNVMAGSDTWGHARRGLPLRYLDESVWGMEQRIREALGLLFVQPYSLHVHFHIIFLNN